MADLYLDWKGDLQLTPSGDLAMSDGDQLVQQRIIRRLFTSVRGYIWHQNYGAGLIGRIGRPASPQNIASLVRSHLKLEQTVSQIPVPSVSVTEPQSNPGLFIISIKYVDSATGNAVALGFEVPSS